jgi:cytochrome oxidase Cu insertion factor (SCO1/SenC/PrrC family)
MKTKQVLFNIVLFAAFLVSACSGVATPTADKMMDKETPTPDTMMPHGIPTTDAMMSHETPTADAMMDKATPTADAMTSKKTPVASAMTEIPAWYSASLTNTNTGQAFMINDFKGKVVLVETMAIWCPTCLKQQGEVKALRALLGQRDDFVSIGLDIDPNEDSASLKSYVEGNDFNWLHAVATTEVAQDISKHYGDQFLNPPSTPILIIDRHGEAHPMPFGLKSADELMKFIQPFLDRSM